MKKYLSKILLLSVLILFPAFAVAKTEAAIFAGGCFWCVEADFDKVPGVIATISGYDGGQRKNPTYGQVSSGKTRYVEVVKIIYDPARVTYQQLLTHFWINIDPTVKDAQFCDHGPQYRSAIFYLNADQKKLALASLQKIQQRFSKVYTQVLPSTHFYPAEKYHQNYYQKNPIRYKYYRWRCGRDQRLKAIWGDKNTRKP